MEYAQAIDHLNTIINERESAVALKEVLKRAEEAVGVLGSVQGALDALNRQIGAKNQEYDALDKRYSEKHDELEADLERFRRGCAASKHEIDEAYQDYQKQMVAKTHMMTERIKAMESQVAEAEAQARATEAKRKQQEDELAAAVKAYQDYKAGLK